MKELIIAIKTKTKITKELEKLYNVSYYKEQTFLEKLLFKEKKYPDIYFHQGVVNNEALDFVENSKATIVNTNYLKEKILEKRTYLNPSKIDVIYPYVVSSIEYDKKLKKAFKEQYNISKEEGILFFTGTNLLNSGLDKFLQIVSSLENKNYKVLIYTDKIQREKLQQKLQKYKLLEKTIIIDETINIDELFIISDIFILPTKQKLFAPNMLKAMYYKNAVLINRDNSSSELIDSFSLLLGDEDMSATFKVDALLVNKKELKTVQKENYLVVKNLTFESYLETIKRNIENIFSQESLDKRDN